MSMRDRDEERGRPDISLRGIAEQPMNTETTTIADATTRQVGIRPPYGRADPRCGGMDGYLTSNSILNHRPQVSHIPLSAPLGSRWAALRVSFSKPYPGASFCFVAV